MEELPPLYTLTSTGKVEFWRIAAGREGDRAFIRREYGQQGGKTIVAKKEVKVARSRPDIYEQARFEARGDWEDKKRKRGYVEEAGLPGLVAAAAGRVGRAPPAAAESAAPPAAAGAPGEESGALPGAAAPQPHPQPAPPRGFKFLPMLANKFPECGRHLRYPCVAQPKLDGVRRVARREGATIVLTSRGDKVAPFFGEIKQALLELNPDPDVYLDGEFYSRRVGFAHLNGYCNTTKLESYEAIPPEDLASIHYHVFDCYFAGDPQRPFAARYEYLRRLFAANRSPYLELVPNREVASENEIVPLHDRFVAEGFEGVILRNAGAPYRLKDRSNDLLKHKSFRDAEFEIVGAQCGEGKEEGCVVWQLRVPRSEKTFACRPRDTYEARQRDWAEYQRNPRKFLGKLYTVRFQETYPDGTPRFPAGVALRFDLEKGQP
jgi:DNA ligase-1